MRLDMYSRSESSVGWTRIPYRVAAQLKHNSCCRLRLLVTMTTYQYSPRDTASVRDMAMYSFVLRRRCVCGLRRTYSCFKEPRREQTSAGTLCRACSVGAALALPDALRLQCPHQVRSEGYNLMVDNPGFCPITRASYSSTQS